MLLVTGIRDLMLSDFFPFAGRYIYHLGAGLSEFPQLDITWSFFSKILLNASLSGRLLSITLAFRSWM